MDTQAAIKAHGAKAVYEAASRRMAGDMHALPAIGLQNTLADAWGIMCEAHRRMSASDQAADYWDAQQNLSRNANHQETKP